MNLLTKLSENIVSPKEINSNEQIIDRWLNFGEVLWEEHEIYQYMLIKLKNE